MMNRPRPTTVVVHVYDLGPANDSLYPIGLGAYHTGVVVDGVEYSFAGSPGAPGSGIQEGQPGYAPGAVFRQEVRMGEIQISRMQIQQAIDKLRPDFQARDYHLMRKNCNNFSDAFCYELMGRHIPSWINRMAWWGQCCSCLWPDELQDQQPQSNVEAAPKFRAFEGEGNRLDSSEQKSSGGMFSRKNKAKKGGAQGGGGAPVDAEERRRRAAEAASKRLAQSQAAAIEVRESEVDITVDSSTPSSKTETSQTNLL